MEAGRLIKVSIASLTITVRQILISVDGFETGIFHEIRLWTGFSCQLNSTKHSFDIKVHIKDYLMTEFYLT